MSWQTATAKTYTPDTQRLLTYVQGDINALLQLWQAKHAELEAAKATEMGLRRAVFEVQFPDAKEGTQRVAIGNGWFLKAVYPQNYRLDKDTTEGVQAAIAKISTKAEVVGDRLVNWKPELSIKEYRLLEKPELTPEEQQIKKLIDGVLTITPGAPQLELEEPKA